LNTAIIAFAQGLGFAVPANTARWVASELLQHGRVRRLELGIRASAVPIPRWLSRRLDLLSDQAVEVVEVFSDSAADRAGIRPGDWIVTAAGRIISGIDDLHRVLTTIPAQEVPMEIVRNENRLDLTVVLRL
jgi:S1-C subfamily serine protease